MADDNTTTDIEGVEVAYPGTWNGTPFTREDLAGMVEAFGATREVLPPRLQLGHDLKQRLARAMFGKDHAGADGFPALGWPKRLYMRGSSFLADCTGVPVELAAMIGPGKPYRARSMGVLFNVTVDGHKWPMVSDHVALLGDQAPAVPGLADVKLARNGATWESEAVFTMDTDATALGDGVDGDGGVELAAGDDPQATLDRINALLDEAHNLAAGLVRGRTGAPMVAAYMRGYRERLSRIVRQGLATKEGTNMAAGDVQPTGPAPAGGMAIASADVLAAMLAAKLGLAPDAFGDIYAALGALIDGAPGGAPEPMTDGGGVAMATETQTGTPDVVTLARVDLDALQAAIKAADNRAAKAEADVAKVTIERAQEAAERRADADIAARSLPASVRGTLVMLARDGHEDEYKAVVETSKAVPTTEQGTSTGGVNLAALEPDAMETKVATALGLTVDQFRAQKAREAGVTLPAKV